MRGSCLRIVAFSVAVLLLGARVVAQDGPTTRELMWFAPTADDWKKPCLITWQRTWEDAVAVSKETGKPILICINMDGEIASEHYAGVRYRQPEIAKLYEPYVCVVVSVYRHSEQDYDEQGRRVPCPRFGGVTCGEHIDIEPFIYENFMDGRRIAPRHIGVELDGKEMYDVFYAWDTDTIFNALRKGIADRPAPTPLVRGDRSLVEKVASRDAVDRVAVETAYQAGSHEVRKSLMEAALATGPDAPVDLLRLGIFGLDPDADRLARRALAQSGSTASVDLIGEALRTPVDQADKDALVGALTRLGERSPRARTMSVVHQGLGIRSEVVDAEEWSRALEQGNAIAAGVAARGLSPLARQVAAANRRAKQAERVLGRRKALDSSDAALLIETADACIAQALDEGVSLPGSQELLKDARAAALRAESLGAYGWSPNATLATAEYYLGNTDVASKRAEQAMRHGAQDQDSWNAMVVVGLFADMRRNAIVKAVEEKKDWPKQWLTDVHAAYSVLGRHPDGEDEHVAVHYDFLQWLGALGQASRVLDEGLKRFPESDYLHGRHRIRLLREGGVSALEPAYEEMLAAPDAPPCLRFFAGLASVRAAEHYRRTRRPDDALAAYARAVSHFETCAEVMPDWKASTDRAVAGVIGARARMALERNEDEAALTELLASIEKSPGAFATADGLNVAPGDTARALAARFKAAKRDDLAARLNTALSKLDPELLRLPAYEREPGAASRPATRQGR